ncbi:hypothetical protein [Brevifollis gellanilyticus]|uniref:PsbP C-terminal domain-containing protein n=1 Tax=Brevifollis gellanilyticus TaxID=748831 RepID=A0A512M5B6_9BACT|nr:hypothetical protein [Brevifollis gellanilyticus]GEP41927.1 hypothetical protein BGE01nite_12180 [Brevifollis gellanilyticus]
MRNLFPVFIALLLLTSASELRAEDFDLGKNGQLSVAVPEGWEGKAKEIPGVGVDITVRPKTPRNMACKLTVLFIPAEQELTPEQVIERWKGTLGQFAEGSVEKEAKVEKLNLKSGVGVYASFTDPSLVGKPSEPGNYKVMSPGMIHLKKELVIATTIFADDKAAPEFAVLVKMLESVTLKEAGEKSI